MASGAAPSTGVSDCACAKAGSSSKPRINVSRNARDLFMILPFMLGKAVVPASLQPASRLGEGREGRRVVARPDHSSAVDGKVHSLKAGGIPRGDNSAPLEML